MDINHVVVNGSGQINGDIIQGRGNIIHKSAGGKSGSPLQPDRSAESFDVAISYASEQEVFANRMSVYIK